MSALAVTQYGHAPAITAKFGRQAAHGTWSGPAPKGELREGQRGSTVPSNNPARPLPRDVRVGAVRLPLLLADVRKSTAEDAQRALEAGLRGFVCSGGNDGGAAQLGEATEACHGSADSLTIVLQVRQPVSRHHVDPVSWWAFSFAVSDTT
jgi:hypothetical protein